MNRITWFPGPGAINILLSVTRTPKDGHWGRPAIHRIEGGGCNCTGPGRLGEVERTPGQRTVPSVEMEPTLSMFPVFLQAPDDVPCFSTGPGRGYTLVHSIIKGCTVGFQTFRSFKRSDGKISNISQTISEVNWQRSSAKVIKTDG